MHKFVSEAQRRTCLDMVTPPRSKENKPRRLARPVTKASEQYPLLSGCFRRVESWLSPKRMSQKSLVEFIERTYEMKFKAEAHSLRRDRVQVSSETLEEFVIRTVSAGEKEWRPKPQVFLANLVYSLEHYKVKLIGAEMFREFLTGQFCNDDFLFFMMSRSLIERQLGFKTVTDSRVEDLHDKKLSAKEAVRLAKLVYEDSGIRTADKLTEILAFKNHQSHITLYALLHYLVTIFKEQGGRPAEDKDLTSSLQKSVLRHLESRLGQLVDHICSEDSGLTNREQLKANLRPYCLMAVEAISSSSTESWFSLSASEADKALLMRLQSQYCKLAEEGWIDEDARAISQEILTLPYWSTLLSDEYTRLDQEDSFRSHSSDHPLEEVIEDTEAQIGRLVDELAKQPATESSLLACRDLTATLEMLKRLKGSNSFHYYSVQPQETAETLETVKLRLLMDPGSTQEALLERVDTLRKAERELLSSQATLRDYECVIASLKQQLDILL